MAVTAYAAGWKVYLPFPPSADAGGGGRGRGARRWGNCFYVVMYEKSAIP